ncbi:multiple sugar transport system substrate-binding protein [Paenibacillus sp. UNCCL117]|uniref:ABC transporter substrate-binding protein n=1 Tax=unclassified Paenibacillus TaxID=185978 RepID=UPI00088F0907|nr:MULTISPECIES: extracellular solute-binding protein [unclassified Paenibacillus]SDC76439.1 multiple sugar transport system substrate-binding protein [Paenibacillus sp. cl123]SFW25590.1 multiple sugar transport system substrate-binding protein [Paenibacillus sp. UNCCL117]
MNKRIKRTMLVTLSVGLMVPLLQACTKGSNSDDKTEKVLRIATTMYAGPDDEYFRQRFTELYEFANKNVKIEIIPTMDDRYMYGYGRQDPNEKPQDPAEKLKELMKGDNPPDIVMFGYEQLPDLVGENLLTQLDPLITKDKFDTTDFVPAVLEGIKKAGDGKIYGLSPTFSSSAVIYNKKMFDEAGVPYPTDKMTWPDMFDLARRLSKGEGADRKYGFSFSTYNMGGDIYYAMQPYVTPLQLSMFDDKAEKMTVNSDQWENVWKAMIQLKTEKLLPEQLDMSKMQPQGPEDYNPFQHDDFMSGRTAMAITHYGDLDRIHNAMKNAQNIKGFTPFEWDVVTLPVHQEAPDIGANIGMESVMGINANAQNAEEAWKYIQFINGEDWAKLKSSSNYNIVSRQKYIKKKDGMDFNMNAFTTLMPAPMPAEYKLYRQSQNLYQINNIGARLFSEAAQGKMTVRDALKQWETEGNQMLQKIKDNPNGPIDIMPPAAAMPTG